MRICFLLSLVLPLFISESASAISVGGAAGGDFPLAHRDHSKVGFAAEGFFRLDPYEIRFHYANNSLTTYSIMLAEKLFLTQSLVRPYVEGALGGMIGDSPRKTNLGYGGRAEASFGVDMGINSFLSTGVAGRYFGSLLLGSTNSGKSELNHGFSVVGNLALWF